MKNPKESSNYAKPGLLTQNLCSAAHFSTPFIVLEGKISAVVAPFGRLDIKKKKNSGGPRLEKLPGSSTDRVGSPPDYETPTFPNRQLFDAAQKSSFEKCLEEGIKKCCKDGGIKQKICPLSFGNDNANLKANTWG